MLFDNPSRSKLFLLKTVNFNRSLYILDFSILINFSFMRQTTLVLVFNSQNQILLCMKKRGFGVGKYNGSGGKVEGNESLEQAAIRELQEETGIIVSENRLEICGLFYFIFPEKIEWSQDVNLFLVRNYD